MTMASGHVFPLITSDGKQDRMEMARRIQEAAKEYNKPSTLDDLTRSIQELDLHIPIKLIECIWEFKNAINTITIKLLYRKERMAHIELSDRDPYYIDLLKGDLQVCVWE